MDFIEKSEVHADIKRLSDLLACGIFDSTNASHVLFRSAFIETLIVLRNLMYKTEKYSDRIDFKDDIQQTKNVSDITDLIKFVRDALCHPESDNHYIEKDNAKASFNVIFGKGCGVCIGDEKQESSYEDDVAFFFGRQRIFLNRHIRRALDEAKQKLEPILMTDDTV
jgi:hypothetical protein